MNEKIRRHALILYSPADLLERVRKGNMEHRRVVVVAFSHNFDLLAGFLDSLGKFIEIKIRTGEVSLGDRVYRKFVARLATENPLACVAECLAISVALGNVASSGILVPEDLDKPYAGVVATGVLWCGGAETAQKLVRGVVKENRDYMERYGGKRLAILLKQVPTFFPRVKVGDDVA